MKIKRVSELSVNESKEYGFRDFLQSSKDIFIKMFGEEIFNQLISTPLKPFDWDGIDITSNKILNSSPNIKSRFSKNNIEYEIEEGGNPFDIFFSVVYHYGFESRNSEVKELENQIEFLRSNINYLIDDKERLRSEVEKLKKGE